MRGRAAASGAPVIVERELVAAVASRLPPLPASLSTGVRALEAGKVDDAVAALAGGGAGLTPDGDDILAGYAAWRHAARRAGRVGEARERSRIADRALLSAVRRGRRGAAGGGRPARGAAGRTANGAGDGPAAAGVGVVDPAPRWRTDCSPARAALGRRGRRAPRSSAPGVTPTRYDGRTGAKPGFQPAQRSASLPSAMRKITMAASSTG